MRPTHALFLLCSAAGCSTTDVADATDSRLPETRFAALADETAWDHFTREEPPLPVWARTLAESLPRTAALQLDLDYLQRTKNPLGPALSGRLRWAVADANRCAYAKESVEADLAKAGLTPEQLQQLGDSASLPESERTAVAFARKLTLAGSAITDGEVAELIAAFGPDDVVAIVHTVAHANFQNRIFLGLGLTSEPNGPCPPREVRLPADAKPPAPERTAPKSARVERIDVDATQVPWSDRSVTQLREQLECQKARAPRIPAPDEARLARLPRPDRARVAGTVWGKVSMGYQPVLTTAWFQTMGAFSSEAQLDEVFDNTVFWVVTRTNDCFY